MHCLFALDIVSFMTVKHVSETENLFRWNDNGRLMPENKMVAYKNNAVYSNYQSLGKPSQLSKIHLDEKEKVSDDSSSSNKVIKMYDGILFCTQ
jgi:hypothetical protein